MTLGLRCGKCQGLLLDGCCINDSCDKRDVADKRDAPDESRYRVELLVANAQTSATEAACQSLSDTVRQQAQAIVQQLSEINKLNDRLQQAQSDLAAESNLRLQSDKEVARLKVAHSDVVNERESLRKVADAQRLSIQQIDKELAEVRAALTNVRLPPIETLRSPEVKPGDYSHPGAGKTVMVRRIHKEGCGGEMGPPTAENINGLCQKCFVHPFPQNIQSVEGLSPSHTSCGHPCIERALNGGKPRWYCLDCNVFVPPDRLSAVWS